MLFWVFSEGMGCTGKIGLFHLLFEGGQLPFDTTLI